MIMRDYKFRGKRKDNGEWVTGYFRRMNDERNGNKACITVSNVGADDFFNYEVIPETVGQYTGLKDKNEVEIYEGDIVKFYYWSTYEQRSFPEYVDFRETEMKDAIGVVFWNDLELSWYVKPNADSKVYNGSEKLLMLEEMPLVYCGLTMESISEWVGEYEASEEDLKKYTDCDGIEKIGNLTNNPELLNPPADSPALNTMITDPNLKTEGEVKEESADLKAAPADTANEQATEESKEEGTTEG